MKKRAYCACYDVLSSIWMLLTIMCMPQWHTNRIRVWIKYPLTHFWCGCSSTFSTACLSLSFSHSLCVCVWHALLIHYVTDYNSSDAFYCGTFNPPRSFIRSSESLFFLLLLFFWVFLEYFDTVHVKWKSRPLSLEPCKKRVYTYSPLNI